MAGNGPLNVQLAAELARAGGTVVGLVELARMFSPGRALAALRMAASAPSLTRDGLGYLARLRRARVPILTGSAVVRVDGDGRAHRAVVARLDPGGRPVDGTERSFDVDAVCLGLGFMPGNELARLLGLRYLVDPGTGGYVVERSASGRSSLDHVWVVGDGAEVRGAKVAQSVGTLAGADAASRSAGRIARRQPPPRSSGTIPAGACGGCTRRPALFTSSPIGGHDRLPVRDVTLATLAATAREVHSSGALKRLTRAGMGQCQGRFCGFVVTQRWRRRPAYRRTRSRASPRSRRCGRSRCRRWPLQTGQHA